MALVASHLPQYGISTQNQKQQELFAKRCGTLDEASKYTTPPLVATQTAVTTPSFVLTVSLLDVS